MYLMFINNLKMLVKWQRSWMFYYYHLKIMIICGLIMNYDKEQMHLLSLNNCLLMFR